MNRAIPVVNKILDKKWKEKEQKMHQEKIKNVQSYIDMNPPNDYKHMKFNNKKG